MAQAIKRGETELYVSAMPFEVKEVEGQDRVLQFVGSDETPDRDNDIIEVAGWELANYRKNPVFLWAHDYRFPPIGRAVRVAKEDGKLLFDIEFPPEGVFPFADLVYNLYKGKFLRATSVGFIPKKWEIRDDDELKDLPEWQRGRRYKRQELLELSAVPVPANPNALINARSLGYVTDDQAEALADFMNGKLGCSTKACKAIEGLWKAEIEVKGVVPSDISTETAPEDAEWSKPTLADFTDKTWDELTDAEKKKIAGHYAWAKANPAEKFGDLKLPHHRPSDGKVVWNGVRAAMGALLGARGGVDIPDGDRRAVYNHLVRHYKAFGKEPPEFREYNEQELHEMFLETDRERRTFILVVHRDEKRLAVADFVTLKELGDVVVSEPYEELLFADREALQMKAGAVLNRKNKERLKQAQELIQEVLDSAEPPEGEEDDKSAENWQNESPQADEIDLEAIEAPKDAAGGEELNIEPETLKRLISETVKEELDRARGKVS